MSFLLDTNAFSEITKPRPDAAFLAWLDSVEEDQLFLSLLTVGEIRRGIWRLPEGRRRRDLEAANEVLLADYADRLLGIDLLLPLAWPGLSKDLSTQGVVIGAIDELIAATALAHNLTLVTRNVRHFEPSGCKLLAPWTPEP